MQPATAHIAPVVAFPSKRVRRAKPDADALALLCTALDLVIVPEARRHRDNETNAGATLQDILAKHGAAHLTLVVRTVLESEGNARAMVSPIIYAISDVMLGFPSWPDRGLVWVETFDLIDLLALLRSARPLCVASGQKARAVIAGMLIMLLQPAFGSPR